MKSHMKFMVVIFAKKTLLKANKLLWAQNCSVLRTVDLFLKIFL